MPRDGVGTSARDPEDSIRVHFNSRPDVFAPSDRLGDLEARRNIDLPKHFTMLKESASIETVLDCTIVGLRNAESFHRSVAMDSNQESIRMSDDKAQFVRQNAVRNDRPSGHSARMFDDSLLRVVP
jgi:hypothetical protein